MRVVLHILYLAILYVPWELKCRVLGLARIQGAEHGTPKLSFSEQAEGLLNAPSVKNLKYEFHPRW
jgi:hypothetical protein